jgi:hypothetical protein
MTLKKKNIYIYIYIYTYIYIKRLKIKERLDKNEDTKNNMSLEVGSPQTSNTLMPCQEKRVIHSYSRKTKL